LTKNVKNAHNWDDDDEDNESGVYKEY